ncbi:MAG: VanZ family protein [Proteocatella sp.]
MILKKENILPWIPVVLWMILIFYMSHQPALVSDGLSTGITQKLMTFIEKVFSNSELNMDRVNHYVRKNAHFMEYLILGVLAINALRKSGMTGRKGITVSLLICILYASSDEFHQLFVQGRAGRVTDVLIDSSGALTGILLYSLKNFIP